MCVINATKNLMIMKPCIRKEVIRESYNLFSCVLFFRLINICIVNFVIIIAKTSIFETPICTRKIVSGSTILLSITR